MIQEWIAQNKNILKASNNRCGYTWKHIRYANIAFTMLNIPIIQVSPTTQDSFSGKKPKEKNVKVYQPFTAGRKLK